MPTLKQLERAYEAARKRQIAARIEFDLATDRLANAEAQLALAAERLRMARGDH